MSAEWGFETRQIHAGQEPDPTTGARAVPIYQTTSYQFRDSAHAANLFALAEIGNIYTRIMNPTQGVLEARISSLEGGTATAVGIPGALCVASGQAAETLALLNLAEAGDHVVASPSLYGGTYNLLHYTLPKMGITVDFVDDPDDIEQWKRAIKPNTKAFYGEVLANPRNNMFDIEGVSKAANAEGIPLVVDNTVPTPYLVRPIEWGANIVVHSTTKFMGGHGTSIGGAIVDGGNFDFGASGRFPNYTEPDPSYHGLAYWPALGHGAFILKARVQLPARHRRGHLAVQRVPHPAGPRDAVACAWSGTSPTPTRWPSTCRSAPEVEQRHLRRSAVERRGTSVHDEVRPAARATAPACWRSCIKGGKRRRPEASPTRSKLHSHVANIGDVRSLVIHPASTTHSQLTEAEQRSTGVEPGLVRLSVGLETLADILADLELGFAAI